MARDGVEATTSGMKAGGFYDAHSEYQRRVVEAGAGALERVVASLELDGDDEPLAIVDYGAGTARTRHRRWGRRSGRSARARPRPRSSRSTTTCRRATSARCGSPRRATATWGSPADRSTRWPPRAASSTRWCPMRASGSGRAPTPPTGIESSRRSASSTACTSPPRAARNASGWPSRPRRTWTRFLEARARELARGGRLLVQGIGVDDEGRVSAGRLLEQMWAVALDLSGRGLLDRTVLGEYVFPVYCRSAAEAKAPMEPNGPLAERFEVVAADSHGVANPYWEILERSGDREAYASAYAAFVRAFSESALERGLFAPGAVGVEPKALADEFFTAFERATAADPEAGRYEAYVLTVILARR